MGDWGESTILRTMGDNIICQPMCQSQNFVHLRIGSTDDLSFTESGIYAILHKYIFNFVKIFKLL